MPGIRICLRRRNGAPLRRFRPPHASLAASSTLPCVHNPPLLFFNQYFSVTINITGV